MPKVTINGQELEVAEGISILEACISNDIPLEHFCYHRYLPVDGNCRACMVEVDGPRGRMLTIGCNTKVNDGMVIYTDSEKAKEAQKSTIEFLLLDHPLDCPICDKAGECKLQDNYMEYGRYKHRRQTSRFFKGGKVLDVGDHIILDQERCILCARCVRFLDTVPGTSELGIVNRGHLSTISTCPGVKISNDYSGNVTDICPVGALTLKEFRFKQRVWFLESTPSICTGCARGCNISIDHSRGRIRRYMPRENCHLNRSWICDEGRLSYTKVQNNRLLEPLVQGHPNRYSEAQSAVETILETLKPGELAGIVSGNCSLEALYIMKRLFSELFESKNLAAANLKPQGKGDSILQLADRYPNSNGIALMAISTDGTALLQRMARKEFKAAIVVENDLLKHAPDLVRAAIAGVEHLIVLSTHRTDTALAASIALPVRSSVEKCGTYVNATSMLQRADMAFEPYDGDVPASSVLLARLGRALKLERMEFTCTQEVFNALSAEVAQLKSIRYEEIPLDGLKLDLPPIAEEPFSDMNPEPNVFQGGKAR